MVGMAAVLRHAALQVVVVFLRRLDRQVRAEDRLGVLRGELLAFVGGAGLHHHRPALRRTRHIERPAHLVALALVVEVVHLARREIEPALGIAHESVVVPAVPQPRHDIDELVPARIALLVLDWCIEIEIRVLGQVAGRDHVPARAPLADVVERGELARDVIGLVEARRGGGNEADALGRHRDRRQQRDRLEVGDELHRAALRVDVGVAHAGAVGEEDHVELGALGRLRDLDVVVEVDMSVLLRARMPPGRDMVAGRIEIGPEPHFSAICHGVSLPRLVRRPVYTRPVGIKPRSGNLAEPTAIILVPDHVPPAAHRKVPGHLAARCENWDENWGHFHLFHGSGDRIRDSSICSIARRHTRSRIDHNARDVAAYSAAARIWPPNGNASNRRPASVIRSRCRRANPSVGSSRVSSR